MNKSNNKSKIYMIFGICILCLSILGSTIAYYTYEFLNTDVSTITYGLDYYINYAKGEDITAATLVGTSSYTEGTSADIELWKKDDTYDIYGHIYLDINTIGTNLANSSALRYTVVNNNTVISEGTLKGSSTGESVLVKANIPLETTKHLYRVYIWLDKTKLSDAGIEGETLSLTVRCEATMKKIPENVINYISNLYLAASKTTVTNNSITYNYATSVSLMNDRLGDSNVDANSGNIRFYGASPNNYIDIGDVYTETTVIDNYEKNSLILQLFGITDSDSCYTFFDCSTNYATIGQIMELEFTDEASCTTGIQNYYHITSVDDMCGTTTKNVGDSKLYRIIGLFKDVELSDGTKEDLVKIIREDSIGDFAWDLVYDQSTGEPTRYENNWANSTLQSVLNNEYYNASTASHSYFDAITESFVSTTTNFSQKGLNSTVKSKIANVVWNLGSYSDHETYSNQVYQYERGETTSTTYTKATWEGDIALMYPSDYGYATDFNNCSANLYTYYENSLCYANDWLFSLSNGNAIEWLLASNSADPDYAWGVGSGGVYDNGVVDFGFGARPVFYLNSKQVIESGSGTALEPYKLG